MSKEYIDNLFEKYPDIPKLYRSDDTAEFKGADELFVLARLDAEDKKNHLRYVNFLHEAYYNGSGTIEPHSDGTKAYMEWAKLHDHRLIACRLNNGEIRDVAMVGVNEVPYLENKVRDHKIARSAEILDKEIKDVSWRWTPDTRRKAVNQIARMIVNFCEDEHMDPIAISEVVKDREAGMVYPKANSLMGRWEAYLKPEGVTVEEFAKSGYKLISKEEKEQNVYFVCNALEPDKKQHSPWVKTFANKIARFGEREGLTPSIIAEAIVAKTPEQTMENFSKVIENWDKAKAMDMSADTFELNHCQTIKGVEFER